MTEQYFKVTNKTKQVNKTIHLASASPRRREILVSMGISFEVVKIDVDENAEEPRPEEAEQLACLKYKKYLEQIANKKDIVITADTIVLSPDRQMIYGKPDSQASALKMLESLLGKTHEVVSGLCVADLKTNKALSGYAVTKVRFKKSTEKILEVIREYLELQPPFGPYDKAGGYGIQEKIVREYLLEALDGEFENVVGFPVELFKRFRKELNF